MSDSREAYLLPTATGKLNPSAPAFSPASWRENRDHRETRAAYHKEHHEPRGHPHPKENRNTKDKKEVASADEITGVVIKVQTPTGQIQIDTDCGPKVVPYHYSDVWDDGKCVKQFPRVGDVVSFSIATDTRTKAPRAEMVKVVRKKPQQIASNEVLGQVYTTIEQAHTRTMANQANASSTAPLPVASSKVPAPAHQVHVAHSHAAHEEFQSGPTRQQQLDFLRRQYIQQQQQQQQQQQIHQHLLPTAVTYQAAPAPFGQPQVATSVLQLQSLLAPHHQTAQPVHLQLMEPSQPIVYVSPAPAVQYTAPAGMAAPVFAMESPQKQAPLSEDTPYLCSAPSTPIQRRARHHASTPCASLPKSAPATPANGFQFDTRKLMLHSPALSDMHSSSISSDTSVGASTPLHLEASPIDCSEYSKMRGEEDLRDMVPMESY